MNRPPGRIITFYSFKGGTGRSMAAANLAWVLASAGNRVLLIDWDLEAPGVHRYLHPFLKDPDLLETEGLIDFIIKFASAAVARTDGAEGGEAWFLPYADLIDHATSIEHPFPRGGCLELVPAGRQDAQYAARVNAFDWERFYSKFGGGIFLEAVKAGLRREYDFVIVDSRTGVSDTSGICSVQLPDDLVVCFTLNRQSIVGSAAIARHAVAQRTRKTGGSGLRIWPVPTRIEDAEKAKAARMIAFAMQVYRELTPQIAEPTRYWGAAAVRYQPYYAYDEILAVFGDAPHQAGSMLGSTEFLASQLTEGAVRELVLSPEERAAGLARYERSNLGAELALPATTPEQAAPAPDLAGFLVVSPVDARDEATVRFVADLEQELGVLAGEPRHIFFDVRDLSPEAAWDEEVSKAARRAPVHVVLLSPALARSEHARGLLHGDGTRVVIPWIPTSSQDARSLGLDRIAWLREVPEQGLRRASRLSRLEDEYRVAVTSAAEAILRLERADPPPAGRADSPLAALRELAASYERTRSELPRGEERTRRLTLIAEHMRGFAFETRGYLATLQASGRPGEALAAIVILQEHPDEAHVPWLSERMAAHDTHRFLRYHAAIALRAAVARGLGQADAEALLASALASASGEVDTDLGQTLEQLITDLRDLADRHARVEELARSVEPTRGIAAFTGTARDRGSEDVSGADFAALEGIVKSHTRPAILIADDSFETPAPPWQHLGDPETRQLLKRVLPSVGRLEYVSSNPDLFPYLGTAFVVGPRLLMTASAILDAISAAEDRPPSAWLRVSFQREAGRQGTSLPIQRIVLRVAARGLTLLELDGDGPPPLLLHPAEPSGRESTKIAVVGYPGRDRQVPFDLQERLFEGRYEVKRLFPGIASVGFAELTHDASTQLGCAGGPVIDLATGHVLGLHTGGSYLGVQHATSAWAIEREAAVRAAGVRFTDPTPAIDPAGRDAMTTAEESSRYRVLLVGIDAYRKKPLNGCVNDIDAVQQLLLERVKVPRARIRRLASPLEGEPHATEIEDQPATLENLRAALHTLVEQAQPDDRVLIYYSGHGSRAEFLRPDGSRFHREALVPIDVHESPADRLLYDDELNELLGQLRTRSVTVVLDCCHSAGATREGLEAPMTARVLHADQDLGLSGPIPDHRPGAASRDQAYDDGVARNVAGVHVISACMNHELAKEGLGEDGLDHGLFSRAFVRSLERIPDAELTTVPWTRIWQAMRAEIELRNPYQHPWMSGSARRAVLAGEPVDGDPGFSVRRLGDGDRYELDAGTLAGVTDGARVAIYGETPHHFPLVDSAADREARLGVVRVAQGARLSSAVATAEGAPFPVPAGARGRIIEAGAPARLRCAIVPADAGGEALARSASAEVARSPLLELVERDRAEVRLEQAGGRWLLTDDVHGTDGTELFALAGHQLARARDVLEHYFYYALPLRLVAAALDLPGALDLRVLACPTRLPTREAETTRLDEAPTTAGPSVYDLEDGARVCFRVRNGSAEQLRVSLVNVAASGRVQVLDDQSIDAGGTYTFWADDAIGMPFAMSVPRGRSLAIDRLFAIGTTANKDVKHLQIDRGFEDVLAAMRGDKDIGGRKRGRASLEQWTATQVIIRTRGR